MAKPFVVIATWNKWMVAVGISRMTTVTCTNKSCCSEARAIGESILDLDVATLVVSEIAQAVAKRCKIARSGGCRERGHDSDHRHRHLLRARRERPRGHCAADKRDEVAPPDHSITSSAATSRPGRTSRPSALAVCRLITNSNLVGCVTGKSAGFSPLRMRPT